MKKILLIGKDGQVGWELQRALILLGEIKAVDVADCDLTNPDQLKSLIRTYNPNVIVNAAAYTAVDKAESDEQVANAVNAIAPQIMAEEAALSGALLIHYSTDYVFDGTKAGFYAEDDVTHPLSVYGATKLAGEIAIQKSGCEHLIFRTSWVFAARGANFAKTMLKLAKQREELKVVGDQFGAPTSAELLADVTALCIRQKLQAPSESPDGVYHLVANGETTWHAYARYVIKTAIDIGQDLKCLPENVISIPASDYPVPAKRPQNSKLNTSKIRITFGINLPDWQYHAHRMLSEILAN
ncbi:dTDP-4-dehydrorhamnose reductase [Methyloradius palustris]|uniref:dTDP-4-dehydrorhamnose reductase n=1 Tax=Methyloradius palustris TaxID=2778876 RepID=A0A8D5FYA0_9PROT|nr:dTDP-4-dehydrorhamnose reductase [Methyloradius palustris]BCM24257.1 NAD(P)-dependent oxidoreductase [Methyloradius palustris]